MSAYLLFSTHSNKYFSVIESDKPLLDKVTVVSEEHQAPWMTGEDEGGTWRRRI